MLRAVFAAGLRESGGRASAERGERAAEPYVEIAVVVPLRCFCEGADRLAAQEDGRDGKRGN